MANQFKTKTILATALINLAEDLPFSKITVTRICKECGMNRKSFYYHFKEPIDVVLWLFHQDLSLINHEKNPLLLIATCLNRHRQLYQKVLSLPEETPFNGILSSLMLQGILEVLPEPLKEDPFSLSFYQEGCLVAFLNWLKDVHPLSSEDFYEKLVKTIGGV